MTNNRTHAYILEHIMNIYSEFHPSAIQPTFVTLFDNIVSVEIALRPLKAESAEIKYLSLSFAY